MWAHQQHRSPDGPLVRKRRESRCASGLEMLVTMPQNILKKPLDIIDVRTYIVSVREKQGAGNTGSHNPAGHRRVARRGLASPYHCPQSAGSNRDSEEPDGTAPVKRPIGTRAP